MVVASKEGIKAHLERALETQSSIICILREGIPETQQLPGNAPVVYKKIEFNRTAV
jgi:hypothetical protein